MLDTRNFDQLVIKRLKGHSIKDILGIQFNFESPTKKCVKCGKRFGKLKRIDCEDVFGFEETFCFECYAEVMGIKNTAWYRDRIRILSGKFTVDKKAATKNYQREYRRQYRAEGRDKALKNYGN